MQKPLGNRRHLTGLWVVAMLIMPLLAACGGDTATAVPVAVATIDATDATVAPAATTAPTTAAAGATTVPTVAAATTPAVATTPAAGGTSAPKPPAATPYPTVPAAAGSLKITFWYGLTGFNGAVVQQVVNKFNTSQTKYYVEAVQQPDYDNTINKLNTSLAGGALPNVVQIYDIGTQRMIDTKRIIPAQDFIDKQKSDIPADLEPAVASYYTVNGKLYSMPFNSSAPVLYYDRNAFKEVGLDPDKPPQTYDELFAAAQKLAKKDSSGNVTRAGMEFTLYGWILEHEVATQAALYADPKYGREGRATKLVFNNPAAENWLNLLKKLQDAGVGRSVGRASAFTSSGVT